MWPFKKKLDVAIGPSEGGGSTRGYERFNKDGERETVIIGEKEVLRGHSSSKIIGEGKKLDLLKDVMKEGIKLIAESQKEMVPQDNLKLPVRAVAETFDELIDVLNAEDMQRKLIWMKKGIIHFAEHDNAYCYLMQWFLERLFTRIKQIKLTKADKYYFYAYPWIKDEAKKRAKRK